MTAYLETKRPSKTTNSFASSVIQHWYHRFLHGKALVVTNEPELFLKVAQKRWVSIMQHLQQERAHTVDADRLLDLTHAITRMQQMNITAESPHENPGAHIWCITNRKLLATELPRTCRTIYLQNTLSEDGQEQLMDLLQPHSLVVSFTDTPYEGLEAKSNLDAKVHTAWEELASFFQANGIAIDELAHNKEQYDAIDDALDALLNNSSSFLRHARHFQEALHLAQPLHLNHATRQQYQLANQLARRVALLTPSVLHHSFIQSSNETFSLYDASSQKITRESLSVAIKRHHTAGRKNLAKALETAYVNNLLVD